MAEAQRSCETKKQLFVSYCHSNKEIVYKVADELTKVNYKIWIDRDLTQGNILFADIQKGIQTSSNYYENTKQIIAFYSHNFFVLHPSLNIKEF
jgi:hypothetical protein